MQDLPSIIETMPLGVWIGRVPDGTGTYVNAAFRRIMGRPLAEGVPVAGAPGAYDLLTREGALYPVEQLPFSRVVRSGADVMVDDLVVRRPDGAKVHIRMLGSPAFDAARRMTHVVVVFIDITREAVADAEVQLAASRLALAVNHAPIVIWSADAKGVVTLSEGAGLASLGRASGELVGMNLFELYKEHPSIPGYLRRALAGEAFQYTVQAGTAVYDTWVSPMRDAAGAVTGVTAVSHDVTMIRRLQELAIQNDRAIAIGTLAAGVAHEINNPLTFILGHLRTMGRDLERLNALLPSLPEAGRADVEKVAARLREALEPTRQGTERIAMITRELRSLSRPTTEESALADARSAVESVMRLIGKELGARAQVELSLRETAAVRCAPARLVQVVLNLALNAMEALPGARADTNRLWMSTCNEGKHVVIEVADNGPGVPEGRREEIFNAFVTSKEVGTGLGLFVCRTIVTSLSGTISVDDRPGGGARFRVVLPQYP